MTIRPSSAESFLETSVARWNVANIGCCNKVPVDDLMVKPSVRSVLMANSEIDSSIASREISGKSIAARIPLGALPMMSWKYLVAIGHAATSGGGAMGPPGAAGSFFNRALDGLPCNSCRARGFGLLPGFKIRDPLHQLPAARLIAPPGTRP